MVQEQSAAPVEPIDQMARQSVVQKTRQLIDQAGATYGCHFEPVNVLFDLKGRVAGMYRVRHGQRVIRYNPYIFARYFEENLRDTVPHEVAHYIADMVYGARHIRPHGSQWQEIMRDFGVEPRRTCEFDMTGIPQRRISRFSYQCGCDMVHELTAYRHNRIVRGSRRYFCRQCGVELEALAQTEN